MRALYPDCGCPPPYDAVEGHIGNAVCRNFDCLDYGTHRLTMIGDDHARCAWCGTFLTPLAHDVFKGAR